MAKRSTGTLGPRRYGPWSLVAGGSHGIGEAFTRALADRGLNVLAVAERSDPLLGLCRDLSASCGVEVRPLVADLATSQGIADVLAACDDVDPGLAVMVAARSDLGAFLDRPLDDHLGQIDLNCRAPLALCHHLGRRMGDRGRGGLVLVSSMAGRQGSPHTATYAGTRAFVSVLGEGLWDELRPLGVDVTTVIAGSTRTPTWQAQGLGEPAFPSPPLLDPDRVARDALDALGRRPIVVPGLPNAISAFVLARLLPRGAAVRLVGRGLRDLLARRSADPNSPPSRPPR